MTVIRGNKNYSYPKPHSVANSDTESLHLGSHSASETESLQDEPHSTNRFRMFKPPAVKLSQVEDVLSTKNFGKKKMRRYQNRSCLQTLAEENEDDIIVIMESYKSPFARLLEDKMALEFWNDFMEKSEEEQNKIVKEFSEKMFKNKSTDTQAKEASEKPGRISSKLRRTIKIKKNLSLEFIKMCEDDLINFFRTNPMAVYIKFPPTSFDRLLLHAIAQYHKLKSTSVVPKNGIPRSVEVYNTNTKWSPAECFLTDFIKELRK